MSVFKQSVLLDVEDLNVSYKEFPVLRNFNLQLHKGQIVGLIGLNGAGKTSLIKCIVGLNRPHSGNISFLPHSTTDSRYAMAFLPERFAPSWFLKGDEFLEMSMDLYKMSYTRTIFDEAAQSIGLDPLCLRRRVQTYSKGMRQKLGILGTVLVRAPFLVLDEPMSGFDPLARAQVKHFIRTYKTPDQTIFFSSHILEDMDDLCDRVIILHRGEVQFDGTTQQLKKKQKEQSLEKAFLRLIED